MNKGLLFNIQRFCTDDGPGIRTTVFFKGCNLRCAWCHNPESQSAKIQMMFYKNKCVECGKCKEKCPNSLKYCNFCGNCTLYCPSGAREICGKEYTPDEVLTEVMKDVMFYGTSGGGVTFSGGECMLQTDFLEQILKKCKENGLHTAVDTAGHVPFDKFERILPLVDLFLYDVKCIDNERHKRYVGVGNELILENLGRLLHLGVTAWVRIPVIPGVNDTEEEMIEIRDFLRAHGKVERVELLPYHALGEHKYSALEKECVRFTVPSEEKMAKLRAIFAGC